MDDESEGVKRLEAAKLELEQTKQELAQARAQYDELRHQQIRLKWRIDTERIQFEKDKREELQHLRRELRQTERKLKSETFCLEAKLKSCRDSFQQSKEKCHSLQRKLDQADNEKMELKIEKQRLTRKLEKVVSEEKDKPLQMKIERLEGEIAVLKRNSSKIKKCPDNNTVAAAATSKVRFSLSDKPLQMKIESQEGEIAVLKRKSSKIEKCRDNTAAAANTSKVRFSFSDSPSESRILHLGREVVELEDLNEQLADKNRALLDELAEAKKNADRLFVGAEPADTLRAQLTLARSKENEMTLKIKTLEKASEERKQALEDKEEQNSESQEAEQVKELHAEIQSLKENMAILQSKNSSKNEKNECLNMKLTLLQKVISTKEAELEALKSTIQSAHDEVMTKESEIMELTETVLELQESLEAKEKGIEHLNKEAVTLEESEMDMQHLMESIQVLHDDLDRAAEDNDQLIAELKKEKVEKTSFIKFIETELSDVKVRDDTAEARLQKHDSTLMQRLQEQTEHNSRSLLEVAHLKEMVEKQELKIPVLEMQKARVEEKTMHLVHSVSRKLGSQSKHNSVKKVEHRNMVRSSGDNVKQLAQYFTNSLYDAVKTPHPQYELLNSIINSLHIAI